LYVDGESYAASPVLGEYTVRGDQLAFTPRFSLKPGLRYRAVLDPNALANPGSPQTQRIEKKILSLPAPSREKPSIVESIYPTSDVLPENQLKFYIHFSAPMRRGDSYRYIKLFDSAGAPVEAPFLELAEELWDKSGRRLTLLLDPGRVKQDLKPHKEVGRAIVDGGTYTLLIRSEWRDARGEKLGSEFRKTFRVTEADVHQPDPKRWKITAPAGGTRQPLVVAFDEPLDHALLQHVITVSNTSGDLVDGRVNVDRNETRWSFLPAEPWVAGAHRLLIESTLEDLAGNSIARPFEVYLPSGRPQDVEQTAIPFEITAGAAESRSRPELP
ncbi:MAG TPA: Ig-like domain-containing protein, partial [Lacipirellulaceae bacterium]|nr:Ig-like domain-containing protein [Lacipirellulaceae bacterium]